MHTLTAALILAAVYGLAARLQPSTVIKFLYVHKHQREEKIEEGRGGEKRRKEEE